MAEKVSGLSMAKCCCNKGQQHARHGPNMVQREVYRSEAAWNGAMSALIRAQVRILP